MHNQRAVGVALSADAATPDQGSSPSIGYRFFRWLVRLWFALSFRKIRLLHAESLAGSGPAILGVSHPASFLDALIVVAVLDREVHCLLDPRLMRGALRGLLARGLGMIPYELEDKIGRSALDVCCVLLAREKALVTFAEQRQTKPAGQAGHALTAASIAMEAESRHAGQLGLSVFPIHVFLPVTRSQSSELMIYVDSPLVPQEYRSRASGDARDRVQELAAELERRYRANAFRLHPPDLQQVLSDLEEVLRTDLEEDWASRTNWKQEVAGFQLSRFVAGWVEQLNYLNPGRLVALRESLDRWREIRRQGALRQYQVEAAGAWLNLPGRRAAVWFETLLGSPIALFGLVNHLLILLLLSWAGLLKKESNRDRTLEWALRALLGLGCYAGQILLVAHLLGRPVAGYYAPALPLSGLYLWRYAWLLRHRTRPVLLALTLPAQAAKVRRMRKELVAEVNQHLALHAETLGVAH